MSKERDLFDYLNFASNVTQNLQLGGVVSELKEMREGQIAREEAVAADADEQKEIRQTIWEASQALEHAKKVRTEHPDQPVLFAYALEACPTIGFSTEDCDDWQDKKRLQSYCDELESLKKEMKAKISESDYNDAAKAAKAHRCLESLDEYIRLCKCREEHGVIEKRLKSELDELDKARPTGFFTALKNFGKVVDLGRTIQVKKSELEAYQQKSPYDALPDYEKMLRRCMERGRQFRAEYAGETEARKMCANAYDDRYAELSIEFELRDYDSAIQHRTELLEATKRFFKLSTVEEAAKLIGGETDKTK